MMHGKRKPGPARPSPGIGIPLVVNACPKDEGGGITCDSLMHPEL